VFIRNALPYGSNFRSVNRCRTTDDVVKGGPTMAKKSKKDKKKDKKSKKKK
jgi:hypothetical protein